MKKDFQICIVGLGYVGLPLAIEFDKKYPVIGYDTDNNRINLLNKNIDKTGEVSVDQLEKSTIKFINDLNTFSSKTIFIITVPTPIGDDKRPDLSYLEIASKVVGRKIKRGDLVVYESTTYPGCTEDFCIPILEENSNLSLNKDFGVGYSPERINPADKDFTISEISKIVSASNNKTLEFLCALYGTIIKAQTIPVSNIKVAEAAKLIENIQRDVNIALANEYSLFLNTIGVNTNEVMEAAATKWNFVPYRPGLVGGHCIAVDPYYFISEAERHNVSSSLVSTARNINDEKHKEIVKFVYLNAPKRSKICILGVTFKENCPDLRNSKVLDLIEELSGHYEIDFWDPYVETINLNNGLFLKKKKLKDLKRVEVLIVAVNHVEIKGIKDSTIIDMLSENGKIFDVKDSLKQRELPNIERLTL